MSAKLRMGLIGMGVAGLRHADAIGRSNDGIVVAGADPGEAAAHAAAERGITCLPTYRRMLDEVDLDAVVVSLPHAQLAPAALAAAARGKHVLLEKPMATTVADAQAVVDACRTAGVRLMVNFVHRFRAEYRRAWEAIRSGTIGRPVVAIDVIASARSVLPDWVWKREASGGGMMMYNGVHGTDRLAWLMGSRAVRVGAAMGSFCYPGGLEDSLVGSLTFENGGLGAIVQHKSTAERTLSGWHTHVFGTRGGLRIVTGREVVVQSETESATWKTDREDRFLDAFQEFSAAVRAGRDPSPSGADGLRALETVLAFYDDAERRAGTRVGDGSDADGPATSGSAGDDA